MPIKPATIPRFVLLPLLIGLVLLTQGCKKESPRGAEQTKVRVAYAPVVINLQTFIAQDRDLYKKHNLVGESKLFTSANDMISALVSGEIDVVPAVSLVPVLNLESQKPGTLRIFSHSKMTAEKPFDSILVPQDSPIQTLEDLKGKKLVVFPGTTATNLVKVFLKRKGIDPASVQYVPLPPSSHLSSLQSGGVDALFAYEPTVTSALQTGSVRKVFGSVYADLQPNSPISVSVISRKFEREHPEAAKRVIALFDEAVGAIRAEPGKCVPSLTTYTKIAPEVAGKVSIIDATLSSETQAASIQQFIDLLAEIGEIPKRLSADELLAATK